MTAPEPREATTLLPPSQVAELIQSLVKALRTFQIYLPNNPIYHRAVDQVRGAFAPVWAATEEIVLQVVETDLHWEGHVVYEQLSKPDSLAWTLYKDGLRTLTLRRGVETEEIGRFLGLVNRARFLAADAPDDLLTLLWEEEFQWLAYVFADAYSDDPVPEAQGSPPDTPAAEQRARVEEESPPRPAGMVDLEDFDATLYFLDESEISYVAAEVRREYERDVRGSAFAALFDIYELEADRTIRTEIAGILEMLLPDLLSHGEFRAAAGILRELRSLAERVAGLTDDDRSRLKAFEGRLSEPLIVRQLLQSLDEAAVRPDDRDVGDLLGELRPGALETLLVVIPGLQAPAVRGIAEAAADRLAEGSSAEVVRVLRGGGEALAAAIALCGRLRLQGAVAGLGDTLANPDAAIRLAAVQALAAIGSPGALAHVDRAIEDADRDVRLAAVRAAGSRGYKGALRRVEAVVVGDAGRKGMDLSERRAFFEAYGAIAGANGVRVLTGLLHGRRLFRRKQAPEIRACAALGLGRIRGAGAREALERATTDKELVVRNAANSALRGEAE